MPAVANKPMFRFKIVAGKHFEGRGHERKIYGRGQKDGEFIVTDVDLRKFNQPGAIKFELMEELNPPAKASDKPEKDNNLPKKSSVIDLNKLSEADLLKIADEEEVQIAPGMNKQEIIKALRGK